MRLDGCGRCLSITADQGARNHQLFHSIDLLHSKTVLPTVNNPDDAVLPKLGINRKMKWTVVYAPGCLGGIEYPSCEFLQDSKSSTHFLCQLEWGDEVATDIRVVLLQLQLQSGFVAPLMGETSLPAPHLEKGWLSFMRKRLNDL